MRSVAIRYCSSEVVFPIQRVLDILTRSAAAGPALISVRSGMAKPRENRDGELSRHALVNVPGDWMVRAFDFHYRALVA